MIIFISVLITKLLELQTQQQGSSTVLSTSNGAVQGSDWPANDPKVGNGGQTAPLPEKEDKANSR
jgi:hypothetical protein